MDEEVKDKINEAIECLSAGEGFDYDRGMNILSGLLNHDVNKNRRGWRKKVKEAYHCFTADVNDSQKGLDLLLQTQGERLAIYLERQKDHDTVEVDEMGED